MPLCFATLPSKDCVSNMKDCCFVLPSSLFLDHGCADLLGFVHKAMLCQCISPVDLGGLLSNNSPPIAAAEASLLGFHTLNISDSYS